MPEGVRLRPETPSDLPFLLALYRSTREQELSLVDWSQARKDEFVAAQFAAQRQHYHREYPGARFEIVERDGLPVGRLYVHERADGIRVMDLVVVPEARNQGLGRALLGAILEDGARSRRPVTVHVDRHNPARRLYERLGFRRVNAGPEDGLYLLLEARPWTGPQAL